MSEEQRSDHGDESAERPDEETGSARRLVGAEAARDAAPAGADEAAREAERQEQSGPAWEAEIDSYPLRSPKEDPGWAVKIVWVWTAIGVGLFVFLLILLILGIWYD